MKFPLIPFLLLGALLLITALAKELTARNKKKNAKSGTPITQKSPLTPNEQPMYFRLKETLPECVVLAQVAFSALLQTKNQTTRNTFDRKVADFVICTKAFKVLAIVELDDSSHNGREKQDAARDLLLTNAGYKVLRYKTVPDTQKLLSDVIGLHKPAAAAPETQQKRLEPTL